MLPASDLKRNEEKEKEWTRERLSVESNCASSKWLDVSKLHFPSKDTPASSSLSEKKYKIKLVSLKLHHW